MRKRICVDFDGVLHSYESGWQGVSVIPDAPVTDIDTGKSAIAWLRELLDDDRLVVAIFSSRATTDEGRAAIWDWLSRYLQPCDLEKLEVTDKKGPAFALVDDRAITFRGVFPSADELSNLVPWNKAAPGLELRVHTLRVHHSYFDALRLGVKPFEVRRADRDFRLGDVLRLQEVRLGQTTGRGVERLITYILRDEEYVRSGFVVLGIRNLTPGEHCSPRVEVQAPAK